MNHKLLIYFKLILIGIISCQTSFGQQVNDLINIGGYSQDGTHGLTTDTDKNIYLFGTSVSSLQINGNIYSSPFGNNSLYTFILKLDSNKNLVWYKMFNGSSSNYGGNSIVVGSDNSVYYSRLINGVGYQTSKLDSLGNSIWTVNTGGNSIRYDDSGYLEIIGANHTSGWLNGDEITNEQATIAWLDLNGNYINHLQYDDPIYATEVIKGRDRDGYYFGYRRVLSGVTQPSGLELFKIDSMGNLLQSNLISYCFGNDNPTTMISDFQNGGYYFACKIFDRTPLNSTTGPQETTYMLVKVDGNFNVITKLNLGPALNVAGGTPWVRLNEINGELFLGGKIHGSNFGFNWTSFGQPNYISPEDDKLIIAKLSNDLSLKWFREIPGRYYVNQVFRPTPFGQDILFYGQNKSFVMDGNSVTMDGLHDIFIMTVSDLDSTTIEIKGNVFYDVDNNGINTGVDLPIPFIEVKNTSLIGSLFFTNITGDYTTNGVLGPQVIKTPTPPLYWQRTTPDSLLVNVNSVDTIIDNIDFGYRPIPGIKDLRVDIIPLTQPRSGFPAYYIYEVCNIGTDTLSPDLWVEQDTALIFLNSSISPDTIFGDSLLYILPSMPPNSCIQISITDSVSAVASFGDVMFQHATAIPIVNDTIPQDNSEFLTEIVIASYDPNDITVFPKCDVSKGFVQNGNNLEYLIRFQNTGNAEAINITIKDTLPSELNLSSIKYISSSDSVGFSIVNNVLTIQFDSIMLPDSSMSLEDSQGYFKYSINALTNISIGNTINNKVSIFFDYNAPIITNTASTIIVASEDLVMLNVTPPTCTLVNNGSISFLSNCMEGDLMASINSSPFSIVSNQLFDNLFTGNYEIVITNGIDTSFTDSVYVGSTNIITNQNNSVCQGDSVLLGGTYQTTGGVYIDSLQTFNGCDSILSTTLTVNNLPNVILASFVPDTLCITANVATLPSGSPSGGNYTGNGVIGGNFDPSTASVGTHDIIYTYTDGNSCTNSDTTIITVDICTGINNASTDFGIFIYPNPSTGKFTIEKPNGLNKEVQVKLLDATSKLIQEKVIPVGKQKVEMDIRNYSKGVYYLQLIVDDEIFVKQLLKN